MGRPCWWSDPGGALSQLPLTWPGAASLDRCELLFFSLWLPCPGPQFPHLYTEGFDCHEGPLQP